MAGVPAGGGKLDSFFDEELAREQQAMAQRQVAAMNAAPRAKPEKMCPKCQAEIPNAVNFCVMCGYGNPDNHGAGGRSRGGGGGGISVNEDTMWKVWIGFRVVLIVLRVLAALG